jgi:hypothetical protein
MWHDLMDRLTYAFLGFLSGALLAAVLYLLFEQGWSWRRYGPSTQMGFQAWLTYLGGGFAITGFLFRFHVGTVVGWAFKLLYHWQMWWRHENPRMPAWRGFLWLLAAMVAFWFFW